MGTAGIICEYNPFHQGHQHQIAALRQVLGADTGVVCMMSGNFVQRGEPAVYDKWTRAEAAVRGGADLVLELPLTAAVNGAGYFAAGGVDALDALGIVEHLVFGSEEAALEEIVGTAECLGTADFEAALGERLRQGMSYPRARQEVLEDLGRDPGALTLPNSSLGVDYVRRLLETGSAMNPVVIPRDRTLPGATELRRTLREAGAPIHSLQNGERAMLAVLRRLEDGDFRQAPFGGEGLWSKVMKACRREPGVQEILFACKSKRYTLSRLRRMLLCLFLGLSEEDLRRPASYLRVLAFNDRGRELLRRCRETSRLPLLAGGAPRDREAGEYFALEARATDLYGLFAPPGAREAPGREAREKPVYVR